MTDELEYLKQRIPLLDYLQQRNWTARRVSAHLEFVGLCPLHPDTRPSFYVNASKDLFYCHGCGRGGDLIRFIGLSQGLSFRQSVAYLQRQIPPAADSEWLETVASFYQFQLHRYAEAVPYLQRRGLRDAGLIEELGIGYAPAIGKLRNHLVAHGYGLDRLLETGLITPQGRDTFCRRVIFPLGQPGPLVNLYGRSIGAAFPHRLLPRPKGGLFAWDSVRCCSTVILVERTSTWPAMLLPQIAASGRNPARQVAFLLQFLQEEASESAPAAILPNFRVQIQQDQVHQPSLVRVPNGAELHCSDLSLLRKVGRFLSNA